MNPSHTHQVYPDYKPSGVEWLDEIPEHWDVTRLKHLSTINDDVLKEDTQPDCEIKIY